MAKSVLITMTFAGLNVGPTLDLYSDVDGYTTPFETGVLKVDLEAGYISSLVPDAAIRIRAYSLGVCTSYAQCSIAIAHSLGYSATSCEEACSSTPVIYYSQCSTLILYYCYLWTDTSLTSAFEAPAGYYSDGVNCYDYRFPHSGFIAITPCGPTTTTTTTIPPTTTTTTTIPPTTTTTTTAAPLNYEVNMYDNSCGFLGGGIVISNSGPLNVGQYYRTNELPGEIVQILGLTSSLPDYFTNITGASYLTCPDVPPL